jgi:hypothetical protein
MAFSRLFRRSRDMGLVVVGGISFDMIVREFLLGFTTVRGLMTDRLIRTADVVM